ncbi:MAG TPA: hypothetical protein VHD36_15585 [Pirellulales bacterium]|nr:hypothetical protein [Pirellulales bacterium]
MHIDSVRELKASLISSMPSPATAQGLGRTGKGPRLAAFAATAIASAAGPHRYMALGVAKSKRGFALAVRIQRREIQTSELMNSIRKKAKGEVDVRYVGRIVKKASAPWNRKRVRPLVPGISIGHYKITAGTLGCFVTDRSGDTVYMLSNNHVLANENGAKTGDAILQPGVYDGGKNPADLAGKLSRFIRLTASRPNLVDCAIAEVAAKIKYDAKKLRGLGTIAGLGDPADINDKVAKLGRTTGVTHGKVTAIEVDQVVVAYDLGNLTFNGQIEIEGQNEHPFSDGGDSGSLIVNDDLEGVALLFAGSDQGGSNGHGLTYANPLATVLDRLKVDLL